MMFGHLTSVVVFMLHLCLVTLLIAVLSLEDTFDVNV